VSHGCIRTKPDLPHPERLLIIYETALTLVRDNAPGQAAMEALYFGKNVSSALPVGEAKGVLSLACVQAGVPLREFRPTEIKKAVTGVARSDKTQVQEMVRVLLGLAEPPAPDHAADALAAAICAANTSLLGTR